MSNTDSDELDANQPRHEDIDESKRTRPERCSEESLLTKERAQKHKGEDGQLVN